MTPDTITVDGVTYVRAYPVAPGRCPGCGTAHNHWTAPNIVRAFQAWADQHGSAPSNWNWLKATPDYPSFRTVHNVFGTWRAGVLAAGLTPRQPTWTRDAILAALAEWARTHDGQAPREADWRKAAPERPSSFTVKKRFGTWNAALDEAGFFLRGPYGHRLVSVPGAEGRDVLVDAEPVRVALRFVEAAELATVAEEAGVTPDYLYRVKRGRIGRLRLSFADRVLAALGRPDLLVAA